MWQTAGKSGPGKCGMDIGDSGSGLRDRAVTVDLSLNAQSDRSHPYDSFPLLPIWCRHHSLPEMRPQIRDGTLWWFRPRFFLYTNVFWLSKEMDGFDFGQEKNRMDVVKFGGITRIDDIAWEKNFQTVSN
jgi:hypothetical protein